MQYQEQLEQYGDDSVSPGELLFCVFILVVAINLHKYAVN
jgi:hypothetical protein